MEHPLSDSADSAESAASAFSYPAFRRYWISRLLSALATQMQSVAIGWQVYDLTHRALDLGLVGLAQFLPGLGLALVAGYVVDHYDRRSVLALCTGLEAVCSVLLFALTFSANTNVVPIFGVLILFGIARAFVFPAGVALMPNLVPQRQYVNAAAWSSSAWQSATIAGPALGGMIYVLGPETVYAISGLLLCGSSVLVLSIRIQRTISERRAANWQTVIAGVAFIRRQPLVLGAISLDLFAVLLGGATALLPIYARDILQVGPTGLGILRSAPAAGALLTALFVARRPIRHHAGPLLLGTVGIFGAATIGFGVSHNLWFSLLMLVVMGASDMVSVVIRRVLVLVATPDEMRGRVSAVESVFIGASNELGEFESGVTAAWFGVVPAVVLGGVGTIGIVSLWAKIFPQLRAVDALETPQ